MSQTHAQAVQNSQPSNNPSVVSGSNSGAGNDSTLSNCLALKQKIIRTDEIIERYKIKVCEISELSVKLEECQVAMKGLKAELQKLHQENIHLNASLLTLNKEVASLQESRDADELLIKQLQAQVDELVHWKREHEKLGRSYPGLVDENHKLKATCQRLRRELSELKAGARYRRGSNKVPPVIVSPPLVLATPSPSPPGNTETSGILKNHHINTNQTNISGDQPNIKAPVIPEACCSDNENWEEVSETGGKPSDDECREIKMDQDPVSSGSEAKEPTGMLGQDDLSIHSEVATDSCSAKTPTITSPINHMPVFPLNSNSEAPVQNKGTNSNLNTSEVPAVSNSNSKASSGKSRTLSSQLFGDSDSEQSLSEDSGDEDAITRSPHNPSNAEQQAASSLNNSSSDSAHNSSTSKQQTATSSTADMTLDNHLSDSPRNLGNTEQQTAISIDRTVDNSPVDAVKEPSIGTTDNCSIVENSEENKPLDMEAEESNSVLCSDDPMHDDGMDVQDAAVTADHTAADLFVQESDTGNSLTQESERTDANSKAMDSSTHDTRENDSLTQNPSDSNPREINSLTQNPSDSDPVETNPPSPAQETNNSPLNGPSSVGHVCSTESRVIVPCVVIESAAADTLSSCDSDSELENLPNFEPLSVLSPIPGTPVNMESCCIDSPVSPLSVSPINPPSAVSPLPPSPAESSLLSPLPSPVPDHHSMLITPIPKSPVSADSALSGFAESATSVSVSSSTPPLCFADSAPCGVKVPTPCNVVVMATSVSEEETENGPSKNKLVLSDSSLFSPPPLAIDVFSPAKLAISESVLKQRKKSDQIMEQMTEDHMSCSSLPGKTSEASFIGPIKPSSLPGNSTTEASNSPMSKSDPLPAQTGAHMSSDLVGDFSEAPVIGPVQPFSVPGNSNSQFSKVKLNTSSKKCKTGKNSKKSKRVNSVPKNNHLTTTSFDDILESFQQSKTQGSRKADTYKAPQVPPCKKPKLSSNPQLGATPVQALPGNQVKGLEGETSQTSLSDGECESNDKPADLATLKTRKRNLSSKEPTENSAPDLPNCGYGPVKQEPAQPDIDDLFNTAIPLLGTSGMTTPKPVPSGPILSAAQRELPAEMQCPLPLPEWLVSAMAIVAPLKNQADVYKCQQKKKNRRRIVDPINRQKGSNEVNYITSYIERLVMGQITLSALITMFTNPRNISSTKPLVPTLVKFLTDNYLPSIDCVVQLYHDKCDQIRTNTSHQPLSPAFTPALLGPECLLLALAIHLPKMNPTLNTFIQELDTALYQTIVSQRVRFHQLAAMLRLFTGICRIQGNTERVIFMCYDLLKKPLLVNEFQALVGVGAVWPLPLARRVGLHASGSEAIDTKELEKQCLSYTMEVVTMTTIRERAPEYIRSLATHMYTLCGWVQVSPGALDRLISALLHSLNTSAGVYVDYPDPNTLPWRRPRPSILAYHIVHCLRLISSCQGWVWTNDNLIRNHLWPFLKKWHGNDGVKEAAAVCIVRLIGFISVAGDPQSSSISQLQRVLIALLSKPQTQDKFPAIQLAAVDSLLEICPAGHPKAADTGSAVRVWLNSLPRPAAMYLSSEFSERLLSYQIPS